MQLIRHVREELQAIGWCDAQIEAYQTLVSERLLMGLSSAGDDPRKVQNEARLVELQAEIDDRLHLFVTPLDRGLSREREKKMLALGLTLNQAEEHGLLAKLIFQIDWSSIAAHEKPALDRLYNQLSQTADKVRGVASAPLPGPQS